jgi:hypothetical protein
VEIRVLRREEHVHAAAVAARALADSPTTAAIYGSDPLAGLRGLYHEFSDFFQMLPLP